VLQEKKAVPLRKALARKLKLNNLTVTAAFSTTKALTAEGNLVIVGMANTVAKDRSGDVILASAWTTSNALTNFMKNPIILAFHDHRQPIGKAISIKPTSYGLEVEVEISKAAGHLFDLIKEGILKTFSVGFNCLDADYDPATGLFIIKDVELHEISVVSVPCNQDSTFEVAKSLNAHDYSEFKKSFKKPEAAPALPAQKLSLIEKLAYELGIKGTK
jgi:HK97 family phage prohead protease